MSTESSVAARVIIGISGKMGTGQTTLATHLAELGGGRGVSFADALREEVADVFSVPVEALTSRECKDLMRVPVGFQTLSVRELLQWWGALRRQGDPLYWVDKTLSGVDADQKDLTIIDDVRYRNEAAAIIATGGYLIRLHPYQGWVPGIGSLRSVAERLRYLPHLA
jgi:hypothetical protein